VYIYRDRSFAFLALAMFFPSIFAIGIQIYHGSFIRFISFLLLNPQWSTLYWSVVGSLISVVTVVICCLMNYLIGWGQCHKQSVAFLSIHQHNRNLIYSWIRAMGEEIGWRSYLLPGLLIHFHPVIALNISGLVWGLYHVPIMILLSYHPQSKVQYPIRTIIVQCLSCWISAFVYGWIGMQCQYSMVPPTMMHFIWNQINPLLLGSIYTNTPGWMKGEQWKINGEGLMGCIVYFIAAIIISIQLW
jgi:membrane protease YdiL (CAAX protease family)